MKVAYLFSRYPVPSQTFCDTEMRALEAAGIEVEIFSCSPPTTSFRHGAGSAPKARVFYAPPGPALAAWEANARQRGEWPAELVADHEKRFEPERDPERRALHALYFADLARRRGVDRVHVHFANRATHAALLMQAMGGPPFSFTAHAQDFMVDLGSDALLEEMGEKAEFVVAVSDYSRGLLIGKLPHLSSRIHRIYNGLEADAWPAEKATPRISGGPLRILSAGRLIDFKGFDDLIKACALLRSRGVEFECQIVGEGPLRPILEDMIGAADLGGCICLTGLWSQAKLRRSMWGCDVFALACRVDERGASDVLPTVILEAMAAGRPVVSTTVAGVPEIVDHGRTGLLTVPGDPGALAESLEILTNRETREEVGRAARSRFIERFTSDLAARQLVSLFGDPARSSAATPTASVLILAALEDADVIALHESLPGSRLLTLTCPSKMTFEDIAKSEFLPDAMVIEGVWRENSRLAHRLESWRAELGGAVDTEGYLLAARRALWLHLHTGPIARWHAVGAEALLLCWLGARLGETKAGFSGTPPSGALWRRLESGFDAPVAGGE